MQNRVCGRRFWREICMALLLAACTYRGDIDNPIVSGLSWFSYLDGTDIRTACAGGAPDRYRLVYNGRYEEQVRSYDISADGAGGAYLVARARGTANVADIPRNKLLAPWRLHRSVGEPSPAGC